MSRVSKGCGFGPVGNLRVTLTQQLLAGNLWRTLCQGRGDPGESHLMWWAVVWAGCGLFWPLPCPLSLLQSAGLTTVGIVRRTTGFLLLENDAMARWLRSTPGETARRTPLGLGRKGSDGGARPRTLTLSC